MTSEDSPEIEQPAQSDIDLIVLHRVVMPMRSPFVTSHGAEDNKHATIIEVRGSGISGWGECAALEHPTYTSEYADGAFNLLSTYLGPAVFDQTPWRCVARGNPMAKAGLELALLDLQLRLKNQTLIGYLEKRSEVTARRAVASGYSVGIVRDLPTLLACVETAVVDGYQRVRIKIDRDWDYEPLAAIRNVFPDLALQIDANGSYTQYDLASLRRLQDFNLLMIEQPLAADDMEGHALLSRSLGIPICLDETILSAHSAWRALEMGACSVVNIKVARLGGLAETLRTLTICRSLRAGAWCGGMLDTGIGRAVNIAVAALDGFTTPGDIAATDRYFDQDIITTRFSLENGTIAVPTGIGIGVDVDRDALVAHTIKRIYIKPKRDIR